ncbi:hypothetical protein CKO36_18810 [Rhabdochromatium marinum]|nr:DUF4357 domain-containing protein [Rhabdochromatium marinum]MBK1650552.1 hypothetical protein [Rhabdochromatium marinum]
MSDAIGRSVQLFLVDGKSTGLITAEIMNWTGHVLTGPRTELPKFLARPEVGRTGVYLLQNDVTVFVLVLVLDHKKSGLHAEAREIDGDFILLKGSQAMAEWTKGSNATHGYSKFHAKLIAEGKLQPTPDSTWLILTEDVALTSPSAAAAVILGRCS